MYCIKCGAELEMAIRTLERGIKVIDEGRELNAHKVIFDHGKWVLTSGPDEEGHYLSEAEDSGITLDDDDLDDLRGIIGYESY